MAEIGRLITVTVNNEPGQLARLSGALKEAGINIRAVAGWVEGNTGKMKLLADDPEKACTAASAVVDNCSFDEAVCVQVENKTGAMFEIAQKIADAGINVTSVHATAAENEAMATIMLQAENNEELLKALG